VREASAAGRSDEVLAWLDDRADGLTALVEELVSIDTQNPPGRGLGRCALALAEAMDSLGLSPELIEPFVVLTAAGLGEYEPIDWDKTDAHISYQHGVATKGRGAFDYVAAAKKLELISRRDVARWGRDFDVLVTPTSAILPPIAGETLKAQIATPDGAVPSVIASVAFTAFGNVTGLPAISLPLHWTPDGLPVGVMLTGSPFDDSGVLRLAAQLEQARPWADRRAMAAGAA